MVAVDHFGPKRSTANGHLLAQLGEPVRHFNAQTAILFGESTLETIRCCLQNVFVAISHGV